MQKRMDFSDFVSQIEHLRRNKSWIAICRPKLGPFRALFEIIRQLLLLICFSKPIFAVSSSKLFALGKYIYVYSIIIITL